MLLLLHYKDVSLMCAYIQMNMVILITYSADGLKIWILSSSGETNSVLIH